MTKPIEPCVSCGDETAVGSPRYSDRRVARDAAGGPRYLCSTCAEQLVAARRRQPMTDEERRRLEEGAALFGAFAPGGH